MGRELIFRVDTQALLNEIVNSALAPNMGVLKIPLNVFRGLLVGVAERAIELNDPILNKLMFDLNLYELPSPTSREYGKLMRRVYREAKKQREQEQKHHKNGSAGSKTAGGHQGVASRKSKR